uniref:CDAN1-interacting nuclease 1 n=1 Tax=Photinus pyralis TaxID=7054 RepID=A0A1Y1MRB6_PHOPY
MNRTFRSLGQEYEIKLYRELLSLGLAFRDEEHLRTYGYDKTPDFKLEIPVAVNGFIINWVESKALFANEEVHEEYFRHQYGSYCNRFGPGLVIYWFGFVESVVQSSDHQGLLIKDHFPSDVVHILPPKSLRDN